MGQLIPFFQQTPVFCIPANSIAGDIENQWTVYREHGKYEVYLETRKNSQTRRQHAGSFEGLSQAIIFSIHINRTCSGRSPLKKE